MFLHVRGVKNEGDKPEDRLINAAHIEDVRPAGHGRPWVVITTTTGAEFIAMVRLEYLANILKPADAK